MPFDIPDHDVAFNTDQAIWYSTDIDILAAGLNGVGVVSGCAVSAQGSPDMTVAVAAGVVRIASGYRVPVAAGNATIGTADGSNPRIDLVSVSTSGTKTVTAGTAAAAPKPPALPSGHVALAMVYVPASDTTIAANQITDKRVELPPAIVGYHSEADLPPSGANSADDDFDDTAMTGWTFQASSGSPTNASLGEWQEGTNPSNPTWNANTDLPSALVMQALTGANTMKCYKAFAPGSGVRWAVAVKLRLVRMGAGAANSARTRLFVENTTPTASQDFPVDGVTVELSWDTTSPAHFEVRAFSVNNGSTGTVTTVEFAQKGTAYLALTCATSNAISAWASTDGVSWVLLSTYSALDINGNVSHLALTAGGTNASDEVIGIFEWLRFLTGESSADLWKLGAGR